MQENILYLVGMNYLTFQVLGSNWPPTFTKVTEEVMEPGKHGQPTGCFPHPSSKNVEVLGEVILD